MSRIAFVFNSSGHVGPGCEVGPDVDRVRDLVADGLPGRLVLVQLFLGSFTGRLWAEPWSELIWNCSKSFLVLTPDHLFH